MEREELERVVFEAVPERYAAFRRQVIETLGPARTSPQETWVILGTALESLSFSDSAIKVIFFLRLAGEAIDTDAPRRLLLGRLLLQLRTAFLSTPW